jgi:hypothetical protein
MWESCVRRIILALGGMSTPGMNRYKMRELSTNSWQEAQMKRQSGDAGYDCKTHPVSPYLPHA